MQDSNVRPQHELHQAPPIWLLVLKGEDTGGGDTILRKRKIDSTYSVVPGRAMAASIFSVHG